MPLASFVYYNMIKVEGTIKVWYCDNFNIAKWPYGNWTLKINFALLTILNFPRIFHEFSIHNIKVFYY